MANAFACRSTVRPVWDMPLFANRLLVVAALAELVLLVVMLGVTPLADLLGGSWPSPGGWLLVLACPAVLVVVDAVAKRVVTHRRAAEPR